jgi:hypothetical protein
MRRLRWFLATLLLAGACASAERDTSNDGDRLARDTGDGPSLVSGAGAPEDRARAFVRWASGSVATDAATLQSRLAEARNDRDAVVALAAHVRKADDHSEALVALSLLGEMRSPHAEEPLRALANMPLPAMEPGEHPIREEYEMLESKAVDGLAYMGSATADVEVMRIAGGHPARAVRAEAIDAYLYNHGDSDAARAELERVVQPQDRIFLDRPRHLAGENAAAFDQKMAAFLAKHPETAAPMPAKREVQP